MAVFQFISITYNIIPVWELRYFWRAVSEVSFVALSGSFLVIGGLIIPWGKTFDHIYIIYTLIQPSILLCFIFQWLFSLSAEDHHLYSGVFLETLPGFSRFCIKETRSQFWAILINIISDLFVSPIFVHKLSLDCPVSLCSNFMLQ